ncbi:hypothetical protein ACFL0R_05580 [Pseudomonadota bacterium]
MNKTNIMLLWFVLIFPIICFAQVFKCENEDGKIIFSDKKCSGDYHSKELELELGASSDANSISDTKHGFAVYASGYINGPNGRFEIQDAVAQLRPTDDYSSITVFLYPFILQEADFDAARESIVVIGTEEPQRLYIELSETPADIYQKKPAFAAYYEENNVSSINPQLIKNFVREAKGSDDHIKLRIKGADRKHYWDVRLSTVAVKQAPRSATLKELSRESSGSYTVKGKFLFNSAPFINKTAVLPTISLKDLRTNKWVSDSKPIYNAFTGRYVLTELPASKYSLVARFVHSNNGGTSAKKPGDYQGHKFFELNSDMLGIDVDLYGVVRLLEPIDNAKAQPKSSSVNYYKSPITFRWKSLLEGATYKYSIKSSSYNGQRGLSTNIRGSTTGNEATIKLPAGRYQFKVDAYTDKV